MGENGRQAEGIVPRGTLVYLNPRGPCASFGRIDLLDRNELKMISGIFRNKKGM